MPPDACNSSAGGVTRAKPNAIIDLLEHELGAPLFERLRTGALLTEAGTTFLPHAESLLASMRDGVDAVRALQRMDRGTITLVLVGTLPSTTLTWHLQAFREAYPNVQLRLRTALSEEVSNLVRRGDATLGLRYGADQHPEILPAIVYHERMIAVASSGHRLARRRSVDASALTGEAWVGFPSRPGPRGEPYTASRRHRLAACGLTASEIIPVDSLTAQKRMVEAGFGVALLRESTVLEEVHPQHALQSDGGRPFPAFGYRVDSRAELTPGNHAIHVREELRAPRRLGVFLEARPGQRDLPTRHRHLPPYARVNRA